MDNPWTKGLPYFSKRELKCKGSGELKLDIRFASALPELRRQWGAPLTPTSVCRSPQYNSDIGGHKNSLHQTYNQKHPVSGTMAVDIFWDSWPDEDKYQFYVLANNLNWSCGLNLGFIHLDRRSDISLGLITFDYPSWDNRFASIGNVF